MIRTTIAANTAVDDPLRLAEIYRAGLGRHWNTLREGSRQLAALNLKASVARLQQAVKLSEFPREILELVKHTGIGNRTARELIRASNEQGLEQLKNRAGTTDRAGKSRTQLFAFVWRRGHWIFIPGAFEGATLSARSKDRDGICSGLWSSTREGAQVLGVDQPRLVKASKIAGLPEEVKLLFPGQALTFSVGWQLIQLTKLRGSEAIRPVAIASRSTIPTLSQQELMNRFVELQGNAVDVKVKRGTAGKLLLAFHCDEDDPFNETRLSMMAMWLRDVNPSAR